MDVYTERFLCYYYCCYYTIILLDQLCIMKYVTICGTIQNSIPEIYVTDCVNEK